MKASRPWRRLSYCLLSVLLMAAGARAAGPQTTTVYDVVYRADGQTATGHVVISWPTFTTRDGKAVPAGSMSLRLTVGGGLTVALAPNDGATPAGSYYKVLYKLDDGTTSTEYWSVPAWTPVTIAAIKTEVAPAALVTQPQVTRQYVDQLVATKSEDSTVVHRTGAETIGGAKQFTVPPTVPAPQQDTDAVNRGYVQQAILAETSGFLRVDGGTMSGPLVLGLNPSAPEHAATKQYVDTGLAAKMSGSWESPGAIGGTAPAAGTFTDVLARTVNAERNAARYATLQAAIDDCPVKNGSWSDYPANSTDRSSDVCVVKVPYKSGGYSVTSKITIPKSANVVLDCGGGLNGPRLVNNTGGSYILQVGGAASGTTDILGCTFDGGGIELAGNGRNRTRIANNRFQDTPDYAIKALGASIVTVLIENNFFGHTTGGISNLFQDNDEWKIRDNVFVHNRANPEVAISSTGVILERNDFEVRKDVTSSYAQPNIHIATGGVVGLVDILHNRFGDEVESLGGFSNGPPRESIVVGPIDAYADTQAQTIRIVGNYFKGTNGTVSSTMSDAAIRLNMPTTGLIVENNNFDVFHTALVNDAYAVNGTNRVRESYGNLFRDNTLSNSYTKAYFANGGAGFLIDAGGRNGSDLGRAETNHLRDTEDLTTANWLKTANLTVAKSATGPDGAANSAFTVSKNLAGSEQLRAVFSPTMTATSAVCSVWLKAGTLNYASIGIVDSTTNKAVVSTLGPLLYLDEKWQRFEVTAPKITSGNGHQFYVVPGIGGGSATGNILVAKPQCEAGLKATAYVANGATSHAGKQFQCASLGDKCVGYGTAAPASGRYEVGDVVVNTSPSNGIFAWMNTAAGSPGTWAAVPMASGYTGSMQTGALTVNTGVGNGTGMKHGRVTTGAVAAGGTAAVTLTWSGTAFANNSYSVSCSVLEATASTSTLRLHHIESVTTSGVVARIVNDDGAAAKTGTLHCVAMHD